MGIFMCLYLSNGISKYIFLTAKHMYFAPSVMSTIFQITLVVVTSVGLVDLSPGYLIRFSSAVIRTLVGSFFRCMKSTTLLAYVTTIFSGMVLISLCVITNTQYVPSVLVFKSCWVISPNYFPKAVDHTFFVTGSLTNLLYCVIFHLWQDVWLAHHSGQFLDCTYSPLMALLLDCGPKLVTTTVFLLLLPRLDLSQCWLPPKR